MWVRFSLLQLNIITMIITQTINNTVVDMTHIINLQSEGVLTRQDVLGIIETNKQCIIWKKIYIDLQKQDKEIHSLK